MSFLESMGLAAISLLALYLIKRISEYLDWKKTGYQQDDRVYKAAGEFAHGASPGDIRRILINCINFDEEDIEEILSRTLPHRIDKDGGYLAFIKAVNKVLGQEVYSESHHIGNLKP